MDIDFIVQDAFALTRPQWKIAANIEEAGRAFAEAVSLNYKGQEPDKVAEIEDPDDGASSDGVDEDGLYVPDMDDVQTSSDDMETEVCFSPALPPSPISYHS